MKTVVRRFFEILRTAISVIGFSSLATFVLAGVVALRHMLDTPQALESQLPGEGHLYRWKHGHIFYKVLGESGAPPLLLLHSPGIAASAYEMRGLVQPLSRRFRVYAPDLLGFGLSDRPYLDYTDELYVEMCHDFLQNVVRQPAFLVASRVSCNYVVAVAARAPELCSGLALISPLALHGESLYPVTPPAVVEVGPVKALLYPLLVWASRIAARDPYYYATTHRFGAEHAAMALLSGKLVRDVSHELEQVQQPALVIWGADALDRLHRTRFARLEAPGSLGPKQAQIELLPAGGIFVHEEQPQRVADMVLQWSERHVPVALSISTSGNAAVSDYRPVVAEPVAEEAPPEAHAQDLEVEAEEAQGTTTGIEQASSSQVEAYCNKCKTRRPIRNAREVTMKNGRAAVRGECAVCGTQIFRMGRLPPGYPNTPA
jgi:pimeloyl-ACP methyl ester carboxylesterase